MQMVPYAGIEKGEGGEEMKPWHEELDAATVQRIRTYSAFNDNTSKNLMVQTAMEEGYRLAESIYQEQLIKYIDYVAERKLEEDFCKYKEASDGCN